MSFAGLRSGAVIRFPYLWAREATQNETEGRKFRPTAVGVRVPKPDGGDVLVLFPITSQQPAKGRFAAEIPEMEKRRAGLEADIRLWLILDEYNQDIIGQSFYLEPEPPLGHFSRAFFTPLMLVRAAAGTSEGGSSQSLIAMAAFEKHGCKPGAQRNRGLALAP